MSIVKMSERERIILLSLSTAIFSGLFVAWQEFTFIEAFSLIALLTLMFVTSMYITISIYKRKDRNV